MGSSDDGNGSEEGVPPQSTGHTTLTESEEEVRRKASHGPLYLFLLNAYSSVAVFVFHLISLETLLSMALAISLTIYSYNETEDDAGFDGTAMDFVLLSFAIITPMSASIGITFRRREQALDHMSVFRATMLELYVGHACWDWAKSGKPDTGRAATTLDSLTHSDAVLTELVGIGDELTRFLTLPNASRARHRKTPMGRREAADTKQVASWLFDSMLKRMGRLSRLCEVLKQEGLPPNEATRLRQWERIVVERMNKLQMIKKYRSPQALRSFVRLFSVLLPPFYAPYYAQLGRDLSSLVAGVFFAAFTCLALTALFESVVQLEDPFDLTLDGINVEEELTTVFYHELLSMRCVLFERAEPFTGAIDQPTEEPFVMLKPRILSE